MSQVHDPICAASIANASRSASSVPFIASPSLQTIGTGGYTGMADPHPRDDLGAFVKNRHPRGR